MRVQNVFPWGRHIVDCELWAAGGSQSPEDPRLGQSCVCVCVCVHTRALVCGHVHECVCSSNQGIWSQGQGYDEIY